MFSTTFQGWVPGSAGDSIIGAAFVVASLALIAWRVRQPSLQGGTTEGVVVECDMGVGGRVADDAEVIVGPAMQ